MNTRIRKVSLSYGALALEVGMSLLGSMPARAGGTVTVCTETALRAAMAGGGTVTFACDGTIALATTITNTLDTVLDGSGHQVTISGGDTVRVFSVATNVSLGVINLTIAHGFGRVGGGILNLGGNVSLNGAQIQANTASYEAEPQDTRSAAGGGLFNQGGSVNATNCVYSDNKTKQQSAPSYSSSREGGGALCNESGEIRLQSCSFYSNSVAGAPGPGNTDGTAPEAKGGAIANSGTFEAEQCTFFANSAAGGVGGYAGGVGGGGNGGAVCNLGILDLRDTAFLSNSVSGGLGGTGSPGYIFSIFYFYPGGPGGLGGPANGGGLFNAGVATVANCSFIGNLGRGGGGGAGGAGGDNFHPDGGAASSGGDGGQGGAACGAVYDINALCLLTNCTVAYNSGIKGAGGPGGRGGFGSPSGAAGRVGPDGQAFGSLRSVGAVVMNTVLTANVPGGNCTGTFTDGGQNTDSDSSCAFTNHSPPKAGLAALPPFYLLHNFTDQSSYSGSLLDPHPFGPLVPSSDDAFYGMTAGGTYPEGGAVFKLNRNGTDSSFALLKAFNKPYGALALAGDVLYGTTYTGGQTNKGTVFRLKTDGSGYQLLHSFGGVGDGSTPEAGVVLSGSTLFGTTCWGGSSGYGTIFKIETNGLGYSTMKDFLGGTSGSDPAAELVLSGSTLYGTTWGGGYSSGSTVFKINTDGSGFAVLKHFDSASSGARPFAGLAISGSTLFGTTTSICFDGYSGCGSVFSINTDGSGFTILKQFPGADGPAYRAGLIFSGGTLYGTTYGDGSLTNYGTLFMINANGSGYTLLKQFHGLDGAGPNGNLLMLGNTLYGTTENGGFYNAGVAFGLSLSPPVIASLPQSQTVELGGNADFTVEATGLPTPSCQWFFNTDTPLPGATGLSLHLEAVGYSRSGAYTLVLTSSLGAITSAPVLLNVVAPVERKLVQGVKLTGQAGSLLHVDYASTLSPAPNWTNTGSVNLASTWQYWFDGTVPLPPERFYRAWQTGTPSVRPSLDLNLVPAITLTGSLGHSVRVDCINQFGPTDAWVALDTVTLTNTSQLYFDVSAPGQPQRLYRLVPSP
jgi:uncharacterized repeat protein (TIGR03803 family)